MNKVISPSPRCGCPDSSVLQVGRSTNNRELLLQPFRRDFLIVMTPTLLLGLLGGAFFAHRATKLRARSRGHGPRHP